MRNPGSSRDGIGTGGSTTPTARAGWTVVSNRAGFAQLLVCEHDNDRHAPAEPRDRTTHVRHLVGQTYMGEVFESRGLGGRDWSGGLNYL